MPQPNEEQTQIDFESLSDVLCALAIRSGDLLELDKIADMAPTERAVRVMMVVSRAAQADPWIAKVLSGIDAVGVMRKEYLQRREHP